MAPDRDDHDDHDDHDDGHEPEQDELRRIEREIRSRRGADLARALAGRDGGGHLKGASPTPVVQRARLELQQWLEEHLRDADGALRTVILRRLSDRTELLERNLGRPAATVATWLDQVLPHPGLVAELVREADVEWGRRFDERPRFERSGEEPTPDDPYTVAGVSELLEALRSRLDAG